MKVSVNGKDNKIVQGSPGFILLFVCFSRVFKDVKVQVNRFAGALRKTILTGA